MTDHRQLGVDLFNDVWTLIEKSDRTREEEDRMLHQVHASAFHWLNAPECKPENRARGEWICSRVYAVLGRGEPALHHARRCLELCEKNGIGDWDLAFAYEAIARAHHIAGGEDEGRAYARRARAAGEDIAEADDREHLFEALETLPQ